MNSFRGRINEQKINFTPDNTIKYVVEGMVYGSLNGFLFKYKDNLMNSLSAFSIQVIWAHEMYHVYSAGSGALKSNDADHALMVKDLVYKDFLKEAFPGHDPAFYDALVYAGTIGSPVFEELSDEKQELLLNFFEKNNIYK